MTITPYVPGSSYSSLPSGIWYGVNNYPVLPWLPGKSPSVSKTPQWSNKTKTAASGRERSTKLWPYPKWSFELSYNVLYHQAARDELAILWEFFNVAGASFGQWLHVDPTDNAVTAERFGTGDGTTTVFQLSRTINSWVEPVREAYSPTSPFVSINGTPTAVTYLGDGQVQFASAPSGGAALTWTGYFYFKCRFDDDGLSASQIVNALWSGKSVKFHSLID
jgi:uncharacterized protein (TIGR02217 family)